MEKALLIISIVLVAVGVALNAICLMLLKKKGKGGNEDNFDEFNNNLNEVKNIIEEHITKEKDSAVQNLINVFMSTNSGLSGMIDVYMQKFESSIKENVNTTEKNLEEIRREMKTAAEDMSKSSASSMESLKKDTARELDSMRNALSEIIKTHMDKFGAEISKMNEELKNSLKAVREDNAVQLERVRNNNAEQLEKIRQTVDEKLTSTLNERISNAFNNVNQSLESVNKGFGEMKQLTGQVGNLNKMFANIKTRGNWGEVELESILDNMLAPDQYKKQFKLGKGAELVDFAVVMPGQKGEELYLPIDAKFPSDRYNELVEASESGDTDRIERARKDLAQQIKKEAISIKNKYIKPPRTTNFAIMFLPSEAMYAEIIRNTDLINNLQTEHNVTVCGPTTMSALLNSLQMGFMTLRIQKSSKDIAKALKDFQKDFSTYSTLVSKLRRNTDALSNTVGEVEDRNGRINKKLQKVVGNLPEIEDKSADDGGEKEVAGDVDETGEE